MLLRLCLLLLVAVAGGGHLTDAAEEFYTIVVSYDVTGTKISGLQDGKI